MMQIGIRPPYGLRLATRPSLGRSLQILLLGIVAAIVVSIVICVLLISTSHNQMLLAANSFTVSTTHTVTQGQPQLVAGTAEPPVATGNASKALVRINQGDVSQYASQDQRNTWWASTCSTASMTEVMNAYGAKLKIKDVLAVEASIGAVTASGGLQYDNGIDDTSERFGFEVTTPSNPTISQLIDTANNGTPIIVNFAPHNWTAQAPDWTIGHFVTVVGGTATTVKLADSSTVNGGKGLQTFT